MLDIVEYIFFGKEQGIATKEEIKERAKQIEERDRENMQTFLLTGQSQHDKVTN
ncbi:hypothetical protein GLW03_13000 [Halobacillus halophilus]|uniref:hypothetical protein n=1 Tax=Halobacillus halophilus TaxID=1570 RepID=UPI00136A5F64|nr:hypothetical protein [Halobacillus halophilus]MYL30744.1 hypothetical protein [Halobacillus halophilus]